MDDISVQIQRFVDVAIKRCQKLSFKEKTHGIWNKHEIIKYISELPEDTVTQYLANQIHTILGDKESRKILCVGGGTGKLGRAIISRHIKYSVTELDLSEEMVKMANNLAIEHGLKDRYISVKGDICSLPFPDGSFDYVVGHGVFRYLDHEAQEKAFKEMLRVSKNGGIISEGKAKEVMYRIRDVYSPSESVIENEMPMFRMSLFYMLYYFYETDSDFKKLVDHSDHGDHIKTLNRLAGESNGILYELIIRN